MICEELFPNEQMIEVHELSPSYDEHASDVWLMKTNEKEWIVRSSKITRFGGGAIRYLALIRED